MKRNSFSIIVLFVFLFSCSTPEWPQYLGPNRNAIVSKAKIASSWSKDGPVKLWQDSVGMGFGGVSIHNGEVFILDRVIGESDVLRCLDLISGKEKWRFSYEAKKKLAYPGSRSVPAVDENYVWTVGPYGHMYCISRSTHKPVWNKNLLTQFKADSMYFGISQNPLLYKNLVIVAPQGKEAGVVAFNKETGEVVWASRKLKGVPCFVSPTLGSIQGVDQVVMVCPFDMKDSTLTNEIVSFDAQTGEELWSTDLLHSSATIAPAVVLDNNRVLVTDCTHNGKRDPVTLLFEVTKENGAYGINKLFLSEEAGCKMHPPVVFDGYIYLNDNGKPNSMKCLSMTGELMWSSDSVNFEMGAMILVGDYIINQNGKNGDIYLIKPSPEGYKELGKASFFDSEKSQAWSPLAFAVGKLLVRDNFSLVCVDLQ